MSDDLRKPHHAYHHGNLREAVLAVARRAIDQGAYETLSLRELAKQAGVSTNAPYRHFASKNEILAEVAASGFRELTMRFENFVEPNAKKRLIGLCDVYTEFAVSCPHLYRVMFYPKSRDFGLALTNTSIYLLGCSVTFLLMFTALDPLNKMYTYSRDLSISDTYGLSRSLTRAVAVMWDIIIFFVITLRIYRIVDTANVYFALRKDHKRLPG
jgi:AcrR family transcriptional regulator